MIQLDNGHFVKTADEVKAIRPMYVLPSGDIDPDRCMAFIGGGWLQIRLGATALASLLSSASLPLRKPSEAPRDDDKRHFYHSEA